VTDGWRLATGKVVCPDIGIGGSGFFIGNQGFFITNSHVVTQKSIDQTGVIRVDYSRQISVQIAGNVYRASLVIDENCDRPVVYDYAILRLDVTPRAYFDVASLSEILQGEEVIAIGYPLDFDEPVVSKGIISAIVSRPSHIDSLHRMRTFLTDTLITYGNSGGPLIRASDGKVIGITTMPHEIRDEARERLLRYINQLSIEAMHPIRDLIEVVLKYLTVGFNYAISIEYAMGDPVFGSLEGGG